MSLEDEVKKARFSEQQIIEILKLAEAGTKVADLCRKHGISQWTFYQWRNKYGGMGVSEAKRLKELEEENRRLKKIVADHDRRTVIRGGLIATVNCDNGCVSSPNNAGALAIGAYTCCCAEKAIR